MWISPGWKWTHLPFGEYRTPETAGKLKRMGVMPGWPDLLFVSPQGKHVYVELKREGGRLSDVQKEMQRFLIDGGSPCLVSDDVGVILRWLQQWGALSEKARFF